MLFERDRKALFILSIISIVLSLAVCIPFGVAKVSKLEILVKYVFIAVAIIIFTAISFSMKYRNYRPSVKYTTIVTYAPLFSYVVAILFNAVLVLVRSNSTDLNSVYAFIIIAAVAATVIAVLAHKFFQKVVLLSKNEAMLCDGVMCVLAIVAVLFSLKVVNDNAYQELASSNFLFIVIPVIVGAATAALHILNINSLKNEKVEYTTKTREELIEVWKNNLNKKAEGYNEARQDILEAMYDFACDQLGYEEADDEEIDEPVETVEPAPVAKAVAEPVQGEVLNDKDSELIVESLEALLGVIDSEIKNIKDAKAKLIADNDAKIKALQARIDEHNAKVADEEAKAKKAEEAKAAAEAKRAEDELKRQEALKAIQPSFEEFVKFAQEAFKDADVKADYTNEKKNAFKVSCRGKQLTQISLGSSDFKIQFLASAEDMRNLMFKYNGVVNFDRTVAFKVSNYELQQLKLSYKGDDSISADEVKELIKNSYEALVAGESAEAEAKARDKDIKKLIRQYEKDKAAEEEAEEKAE